MKQLKSVEKIIFPSRRFPAPLPLTCGSKSITQIFPASRTVRTASILVPYRYPLYSPYSSILQQWWGRRKMKEHLSFKKVPFKGEMFNYNPVIRTDHKMQWTLMNLHLCSSPLHWAQNHNHYSSTSLKHAFFTHRGLMNFVFRGCDFTCQCFSITYYK